MFNKKSKDALFVVNLLLAYTRSLQVDHFVRAEDIIRHSILLNKIQEGLEPPALMPPLVGGVGKVLFPKLSGFLQEAREVSQFAYSNASFAEGLVGSYLDYIREKKKQASKSLMPDIPALENVSYYIADKKPLMRYNKTTYFEELKSLIANRETHDQFLYLFGCGVDLISDDLHSEGIAMALHSNVSTEICRDLVLGVRKGDPKKWIHVIQSNTVKVEDFVHNMPECDFVIHVDPNASGGMVYEPRNVIKEKKGVKVMEKRNEEVKVRFTINGDDVYVFKAFKIGPGKIV